MLWLSRRCARGGATPEPHSITTSARASKEGGSNANPRRQKTRSPQVAHTNGLRGGAPALFSLRHLGLLPVAATSKLPRAPRQRSARGARPSTTAASCPRYPLLRRRLHSANSAIENIATVNTSRIASSATSICGITRRYPWLKTVVRDRSFPQPTRTAPPIHRLRPGGRIGGS